jgi:hypothetical protein
MFEAAGAQRLISLAIGGLAALALVVSLTLMFSTTQPYRVGDGVVLSD